jgi:uncharacterized protein YycO
MIELQFVDTTGLTSWAIRWFSAGRVSHVDAVMQDGKLLGARSAGGVQIRAKNYEKFVRKIKVELPSNADHEQRWNTFLRAQIGKKYDKTAIWAFLVNRDWRESDSWYCSELIAAGLEECGWLRTRLASPANKITPSELLLVLSSHVQIKGAVLWDQN